MGGLTFLDKGVPRSMERGAPDACQVAGIIGEPEIRIGPVDAGHRGYMATFSDWDQFLRFAEAVEDVRLWLPRLHE